MPSTTHWLAFLVASLLFLQVPGPSLLFTLGRALTVSLRSALLSVLGNALGVVAQALLVAVGLGAVVATSATAYSVVKLAGAAYVVWLGVQSIRHRADARQALAASTRTTEPSRRALLTGFVVGASNPKTMVFFVAFLPQFVDPRSPAGPQLAMLGAVFGLLAAASDSLWALVAGRARLWFARQPKRLDAMGVTGGLMMVGLGVTMATTE